MGSLLLAVGVALGAFGAHALRSRVAPESLVIWDKAVLYHLVHSLGVLILSALPVADRWKGAIGTMLVAGVIIFSGSLYLLVLSNQRWWGAVTPIGGTLFIASWLLLAWSLK